MRFFPGIEETTTTTGTGTLTLTATTGRGRFSDAFVDGDLCGYTIVDGDNLEFGIGTYTASNQLARTQVISTLVSGTYTAQSATAITLAAGTKLVYHSAVAMSPAEMGPPGSAGGQHYFSNHDGALTTDLISKDRIIYRRFHLRAWATWSGLACQVTSAAPASSLARMGIYACTADGDPGRKVAQTAEFAIDSTGTKEQAFEGGAMQLPLGDYYMAFIADDNVTLVTNTKNDDANQQMGTDGDLNAPLNHLYELGSSNTLPATAAASLTGVSANDPVLMVLYK